MKKFFIFFTFLFIAVHSFAAIEVTVGIAPEKFIIDRIGGTKVKIKTLIPQGKNVHDFAITPDMIKSMSSGSIFFHTELPFEQKIASKAAISSWIAREIRKTAREMFPRM